jgi:hypothetical protein
MAPLPPNPALAALEALVGTWRIEIPQFPGAFGTVTIGWLEGGAYLRIHAEAPEPAPTSTMIVGRDESGEVYTVPYYDSRGVSRVYQMTFADRVWRIWREAPGFWQRFAGTLTDDGATIAAAWEKSRDGASWELDFDMVYTRIG